MLNTPAAWQPGCFLLVIAINVDARRDVERGWHAFGRMAVSMCDHAICLRMREAMPPTVLDKSDQQSRLAPASDRWCSAKPSTMHKCPDNIRLLRDVLELIRRRPAMYLGTKSLTKLTHLVDGYELACWVHSIKEESPSNLLGLDSRFSEWLAREKSLGEGAQNPLLQLVDEVGDDVLAFDRFFELLDEHERSAS